MKKKEPNKRLWTKPTILSLKFNKTMGGLVAGNTEDYSASPGPS